MFEAEIETFHGVGQGAYRYKVNAGFAVAAEGIDGNAAA